MRPRIHDVCFQGRADTASVHARLRPMTQSGLEWQTAASSIAGVPKCRFSRSGYVLGFSDRRHRLLARGLVPDQRGHGEVALSCSLVVAFRAITTGKQCQDCSRVARLPCGCVRLFVTGEGTMRKRAALIVAGLVLIGVAALSNSGYLASANALAFGLGVLIVLSVVVFPDRG